MQKLHSTRLNYSNFNWSWRKCASNQHLYINISLGTSSFSGSCSMGYTQPIYLKTVFSWCLSICLSDSLSLRLRAYPAAFLPAVAHCIASPSSSGFSPSLPLPSLAGCPVTSWRERMCTISNGLLTSCCLAKITRVLTLDPYFILLCM